MEYRTTRFGTVEVAAENIVQFPRGLPGFGELTEFFFVPEPENSYFAWLQSAGAPDVAFLVTNPFLFRPDYTVHLPLDERQLLQVSKPEEVSVHVIVRIPSTGKVEDISANFLAPVVVNNRTQLGCQLVLEDVGYLVREQLFRPASSGKQEKGGR